MTWSRRFDDPIPLADGRRTLKTLREAGTYIAGLPAAEQKKPHWQTAARELLIAADRNGIMMLARGAMLQALLHGKATSPRPPRRRLAKTFRIIG